MLLHRIRERAEDDAELRQLLLERRRHRDAVEDGVHGDAREQLLLLERNAELLEGAADLRIDLVEALQGRPLPRRGVVDDVLVVDRTVLDVAPGRLFHGLPHAERLEPPLEQPRGLLFLLRDEVDDVLVESARGRVLLDVGDEAVPVLARRELLDGLSGRAHKGPLPCSTLKEMPHPQVPAACGLSMRNPLDKRLVS